MRAERELPAPLPEWIFGGGKLGRERELGSICTSVFISLALFFFFFFFNTQVVCLRVLACGQPKAEMGMRVMGNLEMVLWGNDGG
jgi:hypothetical protein